MGTACIMIVIRKKKCGCRDAFVVESTGYSLTEPRFESHHPPAACLLLASISTRYTSDVWTSTWERHEKRKNQKKKEVASIVLPESVSLWVPRITSHQMESVVRLLGKGLELLSGQNAAMLYPLELSPYIQQVCLIITHCW